MRICRLARQVTIEFWMMEVRDATPGAEGMSGRFYVRSNAQARMVGVLDELLEQMK